MDIEKKRKQLLRKINLAEKARKHQMNINWILIPLLISAILVCFYKATLCVIEMQFLMLLFCIIIIVFCVIAYYFCTKIIDVFAKNIFTFKNELEQLDTQESCCKTSCSPQTQSPGNEEPTNEPDQN